MKVLLHLGKKPLAQGCLDGTNARTNLLHWFQCHGGIFAVFVVLFSAEETCGNGSVFPFKRLGPVGGEGGSMLFLPTAYVVRREGYVLTRVCLSVHRGVPQPWTGGTPPGRGVPRPGPIGGTPARSDQGGRYPGQVQMGGTPAKCDGGGTWGGVPPGRDGVSPGQVWWGYTRGGVPTSRDGVPPWQGYPSSTGQQMEYLIRRGRYASQYINNFKGCRLFRKAVIIWEETTGHSQLFSLRFWQVSPNVAPWPVWT